jgi:hypothetical protein
MTRRGVKGFTINAGSRVIKPTERKTMTIALSWEKKAARAAAARAARALNHTQPVTDHGVNQVRVEVFARHRSWVDTTHAELSEKYRAQGLEGDALRHAVLKDLPKRLAELLPEAIPTEDLGRRAK